MPKIPDEIVQRVLSVARIEDVVSDFVKLRRAGVNLTGICPFHDDKHDGNFIVRPSTVSEQRGGNTYRCFVCDKKGGPVTFLMEAERMTFPDAIRYLGKKYCVDVDDAPMNWTPPPPRQAPTPLPYLEIPRTWVQRTLEIAGRIEVPFRSWFLSLPWTDEQQTRSTNTLWLYCVGGWMDGRVVFWKIDHTGVPRAAKLMKFYPAGHPRYGHRDKEAHPGWIYNQDGCRQQLDPDRHTILKPLFGSHLLMRYPQAVVNIVESEKTALVMANTYGGFEQQLWLACGGLKQLQIEAMQPLIDQGRKVWLWPDKDGIDEWQEVADKLGSQNIQVYSNYFNPEDGEKADAADIVIRMTQQHVQPAEEKADAPPRLRTTLTDEERELLAFSEWAEVHEGEPMSDTEELADPRVREWREKLRKAYNFNKTKDDERKTL